MCMHFKGIQSIPLNPVILFNAWMSVFSGMGWCIGLEGGCIWSGKLPLYKRHLIKLKTLLSCCIAIYRVYQFCSVLEANAE